MNVGTKELKNRLSHYLRQVRSGEVVRVTDRGKVFAELRSCVSSEHRMLDALRELEREGSVTVGKHRLRDFIPVPIKRPRRASQIVIDERR